MIIHMSLANIYEFKSTFPLIERQNLGKGPGGNNVLTQGNVHPFFKESKDLLKFTYIFENNIQLHMIHGNSDS